MNDCAGCSKTVAVISSVVSVTAVAFFVSYYSCCSSRDVLGVRLSSTLQESNSSPRQQHLASTSRRFSVRDDQLLFGSSINYYTEMMNLYDNVCRGTRSP